MWRVRDRTLVADGSPWVRLWRETVELPNGKVVSDFYTIDSAEFAVVFAVDDARRVPCLTLYKHGARRTVLALPAGYLAPGESPSDGARRELREETGYEAESFEPLGSFVPDGNRGCGRAHIFLARGARPTRDPAPGDLEEMTMTLLSTGELARRLRAGEVGTLASAAGIALGLNALPGMEEPTRRRRE